MKWRDSSDNKGGGSGLVLLEGIQIRAGAWTAGNGCTLYAFAHGCLGFRERLFCGLDGRFVDDASLRFEKPDWGQSFAGRFLQRFLGQRELGSKSVGALMMREKKSNPRSPTLGFHGGVSIGRRSAFFFTLLVSSGSMLGSMTASAASSVPNRFVSGTLIKSSEVNANFDALVSDLNAQAARVTALEAKRDPKIHFFLGLPGTLTGSGALSTHSVLVPEGYSHVRLEVFGAGGGGGGGRVGDGTKRAAAGQAGRSSQVVIPLNTPRIATGDSLTVDVGGGGAGGGGGTCNCVAAGGGIVDANPGANGAGTRISNGGVVLIRASGGAGGKGVVRVPVSSDCENFQDFESAIDGFGGGGSGGGRIGSCSGPNGEPGDPGLGGAAILTFFNQLP